MEAWIKGLASVLAGGLVLSWHPGLENAQNSITSVLHISGQSVHLFWLALAFGMGLCRRFGWPFYLCDPPVLPHSQTWAIGTNLTGGEDPKLKSVFSQGPLSRSALLRTFPLLIVIAVLLTLGYMVLRQFGFDSRSTQVVNVSPNAPKDGLGDSP